MNELQKLIKLIWDFRGDDGLGMAKHHCIHLKEFAEKEALSYNEINFETVSEHHHIAFITIPKDKLKTYRDALKPHRGIWVACP